MSKDSKRPARFGDGFRHVVTSDGEKVELDDPRVVHVMPIDFSPYLLGFLVHAFKKRGWKCRVAEPTTPETLKRSKELASGRECLPCAAIIGETCRDLSDRRHEGEITVYYNLDQDGPCQNGVWPVMWSTFLERKNLENVLFCTWPSQRNNYMGRGDLFALDIALAFIVGDILDEAEFVVRCLAEDPKAGMESFERATASVLESGARGYLALEAATRRWVKAVRRIRLRRPADAAPKVLIFGGANVTFSHYPVSDYLIQQGVVPKLVDMTEFLVFLESEDVTRYGFKIGLSEGGRQARVWPIVRSLLNPKYSTSEGIRALRCRAHLALIDLVMTRLRKICSKSGLVYDRHIKFRKLYEEGCRSVSPNGFTETHLNTARFTASVKESCFDGFVNLGAFNCQPAMNTQACVRAIANQLDVPYASIDCEGPTLSANQVRLLETVAVQAKRLQGRNNGAHHFAEHSAAVC